MDKQKQNELNKINFLRFAKEFCQQSYGTLALVPTFIEACAVSWNSNLEVQQ